MSCAFLGHKHLRGADLGTAAALRGAERGRKEADGASLRTDGCGGVQVAERLRPRILPLPVRVPSGFLRDASSNSQDLTDGSAAAPVLLDGPGVAADVAVDVRGRHLPRRRDADC